MESVRFSLKVQMPFSLYRRGRKDGDGTAPDVFIATPCNSGRPCANYTMSMIDTAVYLEANGVKFDYWLHTEDCHVDDARNFLVRQFMESGAKHLVFIDDDVGWDAESFARLLCFQNADVVGGAYPLKQDLEDYPIRIMSVDQKPVLQARADGLLEVEGVPTGFMRIDRKVIEALSEKRKHLWFRPKGAKDGDKNDRLQVIFERMMVDGNRWSGDLNFCREARLLGFRVWTDPEQRFSHQGQRRWEGHLGDYLRRKNGILDNRLDLAIDKLIAGDNSLENFGDIFRHYGQPYAMGPNSLKAVYDACLDAKGPVLECGSGITSIIAGIACIRNGQTVHSLEHDLEYFRLTRHLIQLWKVRSIALYYAPLKEYPEHVEANGKPMMWYGDLGDVPEKFDVAIIDGPPRRFGREGVYKVFLDRIRDAKWIVDDTEDPAQIALVNKYAELTGKRVDNFGTVHVPGRRNYAVAS